MLQTASTEAGASALMSSAISEIEMWAKEGRVVVVIGELQAGNMYEDVPWSSVCAKLHPHDIIVVFLPLGVIVKIAPGGVLYFYHVLLLTFQVIFSEEEGLWSFTSTQTCFR